MQNDDLILAEDCCTIYKVGYSFISSLQEYGLIKITSIEANDYIPHDQLRRLEQIIRLHYDLQINLEGIDAIVNLLDRVTKMQSEITMLKQRLRLYEPEE